MKMCGSKIRIIIIINVFFSLNSIGQQCTLPPCADTECDEVNVGFSPAGGNELCENKLITFVNESSTTDFDYFIVDWSDGVIDTVYDYSNITHIYFIPDSALCDYPNGKILFEVCFQGIKECDAGLSCASGGYDFALLLRPKADISAPSQGCVGQPITLTNNGCHADTYLWEFENEPSVSDESPTITYDDPGTYSVTLTVEDDKDCGEDTEVHTITILGLPEADATISESAEDCIICLGDEISFTNASNTWATNTTWNITPGGSSNWEYTDTSMNDNSDFISVDFKQIDTYTVELFASNVCGENSWIKEIEVLEGPTATLGDGAQYCESGLYTPEVIYTGTIESYKWTFEGGDPMMSTEQNPSNISYSIPGQYTVTLMVNGACGPLTSTTTVIVDELIEVSIIAPSQYCQSDPPDTLMSNVNGGNWSGPGIIDEVAGVFDPGVANLGTNTVTYSYGSGVCMDSESVEILVLESGDGTLANGPSFCESGSYTPDVSYSGDITGYSWQFDGANPSSSTDQYPTNILYSSTGTFEVTLIISSECGELTLTTEVIVDELIEVDITAPSQYCKADSPDTLIVNQPGGEWSGTGIVDEDLGIFDPSQALIGDNIITYIYGSGIACEDQDEVTITVLESEDVTADNVNACAYEDTVLLTATPGGGEWSGPFTNSSGVFDVQSSGVGDFNNDYLFIDSNGCDVIISAFVFIEEIPTIEMMDTTFLCANGGNVDLVAVTSSSSNMSGGVFTYLVDGVPVDNTYSIPNSNQNISIIVQYEMGSCIVSDTAVLSVIPPPNLTVWPMDTILCISAERVIFESSIDGGKWSGPGIDMDSGEVDFSSFNGGTYDYQYVIFPNTSCETIENATLEIIDPSEGLDSGGNVDFCEGEFDIYTLTGASPTDGYWKGVGVIDSLTGEVDVSALTIDSNYIYEYCLNYSEFEDCEACVSKSLRINPLPIIQYELEGGACIGETFTISDSTLYGEDYYWEFGDDNTSIEKEPTHSYSESDTFDIILTVTSSKGCQSIDTNEIYVSRPPIVDFNVLVRDGCAPFLVEVENNSSGDDISFQWIIAGDAITDEIPQNIILDGISTDSTFEIILNVTNSCGTVTQTDSVLVHPYPIVDIGLSVDEGCSPVKVDFGNLTIGNPETYYWDLGNDTISYDSIPPQQSYTTTDSVVTIYEILLVSSNDCGMDTGYQTVTVYPPDVQAFISIDTTAVCQHDSFEVRSFSTPGSILTWSVFDSLGVQVAGYEGEEIAITIDQSGTFSIVLNATRCGTDSDTAYVTVLPSPEVDFIIPDFVCEGDNLIIENVSPMLSATLWDFGEGNTSSDFSPIHYFDTSGVFQISLTGFSTINNCPFTLTKEIKVIGKPKASFVPSETNGCRPLKIDFMNNSMGASDHIWYWDDSTSSSLEENPCHTFVDPGTYKVELVVFDEYGCFGDTAISNIIVHDLPTSIFTTDRDTYCQFYDSIVITNNSIDDVGYTWIIDEAIDERESPVLYTEEIGVKNITLIVENIYGCMDTSVNTINILPSPIAIGIPEDTVGCQPFHLMIDNQSTQSESYIWDIDTIGTSSDKDLDFILSEYGDYIIDLIAINENGCPNDTSQILIRVKEKPVADFDATKDSICGVPMEVNFANLSESNIIDYNWKFGNDEESQLRDPNVTYTNDHDFVVTLIVENEQNCLDTSSQTIEIWHQPIADIELIQRIYCERDTIFIDNNSMHVNDYIWSIGESDSITTFSPEFTIADEGKYSVQLIVSYNDQCKDTTMLAGGVDVYNKPTADFDHNIDVDKTIIGDVEFINRSSMYEWIEWDLGDGSFSNEEEFIHEYDINRGIKVTLFAIDDNDGVITCIDSLSKIIEPEWIKRFFAPNALSPDYGPEEVRVFTPKGIGLKNYEINIYSPWGQKVWTSIALQDGHPSESWNGLIDNIGEEVAQGAYTWLAEIEFVDGDVVVFKGSVTVLR